MKCLITVGLLWCMIVAHPVTEVSQAERFAGAWSRTECRNSLAGYLNITSEADNKLTASGEFYYYGMFAGMENASGYLIARDKAILEHRTGDDAMMKLTFLELEGDYLKVTQIGDHFGYSGMVSSDGIYTKGVPEYTNEYALDEQFTREEQERVQKLLGGSGFDYVENFVMTVQYGIGEVKRTTVCFPDGRQSEGKWYEGRIPAAGQEVTVFLADDGKTYFENDLRGFLTDDEAAEAMPVKKIPHSESLQ